MTLRRAVRSAALLAAAVALCSPGFAQTQDLFRAENRTTSSSGQFIVFGGTKPQRGDLARAAEEVKAGALRQLGGEDGWKSPILIILTPGDGFRLRQAPVVLQPFDAGDAGRKIQLDIAPSGVSDAAAIRAGLLRAVLLERGLRRQKFEGGRFVAPPDWIVAALGAALARKEPGEDARVYEALLAAKGMPPLERFLRQNAAGLRGRAAEIHGAQSLALYECLAGLPDGRRKIAENLALVDPADDPVDRFAQTWPELVADPAKLVRLWALEIAKLSSPAKVEFLSGLETSRALASALQKLKPEEGDRPTPESLLEMAKRPEGRFKLEQAATELQRLGFRAHPLYGALVEDYRSLVDGLARKKRRGFAGRFTEAEELREALDRRRGEITDYLDWYQANSADAQAVVRRPRPEAAARPRNDGISRFLDSVESRGW